MMFVLMLMVIYGIIGELSNPGAILPGVVGANLLAQPLLIPNASTVPRFRL